MQTLNNSVQIPSKMHFHDGQVIVDVDRKHTFFKNHVGRKFIFKLPFLPVDISAEMLVWRNNQKQCRTSRQAGNKKKSTNSWKKKNVFAFHHPLGNFSMKMREGQIRVNNACWKKNALKEECHSCRHSQPFRTYWSRMAQVNHLEKSFWTAVRTWHWERCSTPKNLHSRGILQWRRTDGR